MILSKTDCPVTLADIVEEKIKRYIKDEGCSPGDSLPSELEFAERLNVSRNIVREAISRLKMLGIVESRRKRGLILREADVFNGFESVVGLPVLSSETIVNLYELRIAIDLGISSMVYLRKTAADLEYLNRLVAAEEQDPGNRDLSIETEISFHARLYEITGNQTIMRFQVLLKNFFEKRERFPFTPDRFEREDHVTHRDLLDSLEKGTAVDFREMMERHLNVYYDL